MGKYILTITVIVLILLGCNKNAKKEKSEKVKTSVQTNDIINKTIVDKIGKNLTISF